MADWEDIKRLAADFQRVQLSGSSLKLSERSCIEIVQKLIELKIIEVIYTTDGKEYLTPHELGNEIREELTVRGGRIDLVEIQQVLNVDLSHIEAKINELLKSEKSLTLVLGQLIDRSYLDNLAEEINDKLQQHGLVTVAELAKGYDLPGDFITQAVKSRLGKIIKAETEEADRSVLYTADFVSLHRAKICGAFTAVTKPVPVASVISHYNLQERLCLRILEEVIMNGHLAGFLSGGRQEKAVFVPEIYTRAQNEWVYSFLKQNGHLEYDALARLGISDPKNFIKKRFSHENLEYLESCCLGKVIKDQIECELEEILSTGSWLDILPLLPSICSPSDAHHLLQMSVKNKPTAVIVSNSFVISEDLLNKFMESFDENIKTKAKKAVCENPLLLMSVPDVDHSLSTVEKTEESVTKMDDKNEQRRKKAAGGKRGGGLQGREVKTKSVKKKFLHGRGREEDESDNEATTPKSKTLETEFMAIPEIQEELKKRSTFAELPDEFFSAVAVKLHRPLNQKYMDEMRNVFRQTVQTTPSMTKRKAHSELSEKISGLWMNAKLFEKGISLFADDIQQQLSKHLLQTVCTEITNAIFNYFASDNVVNVEDNAITAEIRSKILSLLPDGKTKQALIRLQSAVIAKSLDDFFTQLDAMCSIGNLEVSLKKPDKKKERQLVFNHRHSLAEQLKAETDPAMALHLAVTLLVQTQTQCMIFAPGRCVPQIIVFLKDRLQKDHHGILLMFQDMVMKKLKESGDLAQNKDVGDGESSISSALNDLLPKVKNIALQSKYAGASQDDV